MSYYQFTLSLDGKSYIRGEKIHDTGDFFTIKEPEFFNCSPSFDGIKPNTIHLSKNVIVCYFEIVKN